MASGVEPGDPAETRISGVVLDNSNVPVPGVTLRVRGTQLAALADAQGQFSLGSVPVGNVHLDVDGSTAERPGTWPDLEFELVTVPGAANDLGMPIYLLPLDAGSQIDVTETLGGTLTLPEYPGFALSIAPGSATFPDGARIGTITVTAVHPDKLPMPPNFGQQPSFIVTVQPPGVTFDPPAVVTHPNVDGLVPGEVTEIYSFDHDMGSFVATGTATVSEDGSVLRSDPGTGIVKGGWHCGGNPTSSGTTHDCPECQLCDGVSCIPDPAEEDRACDNNTSGSGTGERECNACQLGRCLDRQVSVDITGPPDNPFPLDLEWMTNFSPILPEETVVARAALSPSGPRADLDVGKIEWETEASRGGITAETPADLKGPTYSFQPDPVRHAYVRGTNCDSPGNGTCLRTPALRYEITARLCGRIARATIAQDEREVIRFEYRIHDNLPMPLTVPARAQLQEPIRTTNFTVTEILHPPDSPPLAYTLVLGQPGLLAQQVRDEYNIRIAAAAGLSEVPDLGLILNSAWRNPERNEAVFGLFNSRHQLGDAVDLEPPNTEPFGLTEAQTWEILRSAGELFGDDSVCELAGEGIVPCDGSLARVSHVHVERE